LDLAIKKEKIMTKQKALASRPNGNEKFPYLPYLPQPNRCESLKKTLIENV